ncbi:hypothetical protein CB1_000568054, partial [Camelus ferus]
QAGSRPTCTEFTRHHCCFRGLILTLQLSDGRKAAWPLPAGHRVVMAQRLPRADVPDGSRCRELALSPCEHTNLIEEAGRKGVSRAAPSDGANRSSAPTAEASEAQAQNCEKEQNQRQELREEEPGDGRVTDEHVVETEGLLRNGAGTKGCCLQGPNSSPKCKATVSVGPRGEHVNLDRETVRRSTYVWTFTVCRPGPRRGEGGRETDAGLRVHSVSSVVLVCAEAGSEGYQAEPTRIRGHTAQCGPGTPIHGSTWELRLPAAARTPRSIPGAAVVQRHPGFVNASSVPPIVVHTRSSRGLAPPVSMKADGGARGRRPRHSQIHLRTRNRTGNLHGDVGPLGLIRHCHLTLDSDENAAGDVGQSEAEGSRVGEVKALRGPTSARPPAASYPRSGTARLLARLSNNSLLKDVEELLSLPLSVSCQDQGRNILDDLEGADVRCSKPPGLRLFVTATRGHHHQQLKTCRGYALSNRGSLTIQANADGGKAERSAPELPGARGSRSTAQSPEPSEEAAAAGKERCELFTRAAEGRLQYPASNGRADRRGFVMSGRLDP